MQRAVDENTLDLSLSITGDAGKLEIWRQRVRNMVYIVVWNRNFVLGDIVSRLNTRRMPLRNHIPVNENFKVLSFFGPDRPNEENILRVSNLINFSRSVIYPKGEKDWEIVHHHFGAHLDVDRLNELLFRKKLNNMTILEYTILCKQKGIEHPNPITLLRLWHEGSSIPRIPENRDACLICCALESDKLFTARIKLGSIFEKVTIFVGAPGMHINKHADIETYEARYCGKVIDYGHMYTVTMWTHELDAILGFTRIKRMLFRVVRNKMLNIEDDLSQEHFITLEFFLKRADLSSMPIPRIYRVLKLYAREDIYIPMGTVDTFIQFERWFDSYLMVDEHLYAEIRRLNSNALSLTLPEAC